MLIAKLRFARQALPRRREPIARSQARRVWRIARTLRLPVLSSMFDARWSRARVVWDVFT